jgi:translation initiation factor 5B
VFKDNLDLERAIKEVKMEVEEMKIETNAEGLIIKADTIGSLEALALELSQDKDIEIKKAEVGDISKRDVIDATTIKNPYLAVILGFNVDLLADAKETSLQNDIPVFLGDVIYRLIEDYENWVKNKKEEEKREKILRLTTPGKIKILPGHIFRRSKPAIVGIEVLGGKIKTGVPLIKKEGTSVGTINEIQDKGNSIKKAIQGMKVAISMKKPTVGRQIKENDVLYVDISEEEVREIAMLRGFLSPEEEKTLEEFLTIKRKKNQNPIWGT